MDLSVDTTWCPTCSRQILPKRIQVPVVSPEALAPPPCSPTSLKSEQAPQQPSTRIARNKTGTIRARIGGGLVHGTGRVKPNGTIKRPSPTTTNSTTHKAPATVTQASPTSPVQAAVPVRQKTVIDQSPIPLYCSDECRLADMQSVRGVGIDHHPERHHSSLLPHVSHNSYVDGNAEPDLIVGSSVESESSSVSSIRSPVSPIASTNHITRPAATGPILLGYAALAAIYDLPPCPPPPPLLPTPPPAPPKTNSADEYTSGIMMAARRINEVLGPKPEKKRPSWSTPASKRSTNYALSNTAAYAYSAYQQQREVIPGWTDGSDKWRASVYSFARPDEDVAVSRDEDEDTRCSAYRGFVSTPLRSKGVYSTLGEVKEGSEQQQPERMSRVMSQPCHRARSEAEDLYAKWDMSFSRRSESRISLSQQAHNLSMSPVRSTHSLPAFLSKRREVSLLKKGAEGRLLVPDVKMKRADSSASVERAVFSRQGSEASVSSRMKYRRSDSTSGSSANGDDEGHYDTIHMRRASHPPRSSKSAWYDNEAFTYPLLRIPRKEKRIEKRIVDGQEVQVEVEVEVYPELKRLFLFASKEEQGC